MLTALRSAGLAHDPQRVRDAWRMAARAHHGQFRRSGEPYITHPVAVAGIALEFGTDADGVVAALLHDTVEDTELTVEDIVEVFGDEVARLVGDLTKLDLGGRQLHGRSAEGRAANLRKLFVAVASDLQVLVLKLADRLHNMRTLGALPAEKRHRIASETLDVYVPLAHRLGIDRMRAELADLAFAEAYPQEHAAVAALLHRHSPDRQRLLDDVCATLRRALCAAGITARVEGRTKSLWSVHRKILDRGKTFDELADIVGVRVICEGVADVYAALGVAHQCYTPRPGRVRDYIAVPKFNFYQSLHTAVVVPDGAGSHTVELQLRTEAMDARAEHGRTASHYRYKGGGPEWADQLAAHEEATTSPHDFLAALRADLLRGEIFVFTPAGDIVHLPAGATAIDFAYQIHSEVGDGCVGVRVDGAAAEVAEPLPGGAKVEIITDQQQQHPPAAWLDTAVTPRARSAIRRSVKLRSEQDQVTVGLRLVAAAAAAAGHRHLDEATVADELAASARFGAETNSVLVEVARGTRNARKVVDALLSDLCGPDHTHHGVVLLTVGAHNRAGLLTDLSRTLDALQVDLESVHGQANLDGLVDFRFRVRLADTPQQDLVRAALGDIAGVIDVAVRCPVAVHGPERRGGARTAGASPV